LNLHVVRLLRHDDWSHDGGKGTGERDQDCCRAEKPSRGAAEHKESEGHDAEVDERAHPPRPPPAIAHHADHVLIVTRFRVDAKGALETGMETIPPVLPDGVTPMTSLGRDPGR
jgi:hypothetical protein